MPIGGANPEVLSGCSSVPSALQEGITVLQLLLASAPPEPGIILVGAACVF